MDNPTTVLVAIMCVTIVATRPIILLSATNLITSP